MTRTRNVMCVALVGAALVACSSPPAKSGGVIDPVTLHSFLPSPAGNHQPGDDLLEAISRIANASSNGAVSIATTPQSPSADGPGDVLAGVRDGRIDLGIIRASRFSMAGMTSFQALQAPFVIDNEVLAERVASDHIATEMMSGLDKLG